MTHTDSIQTLQTTAQTMTAAVEGFCLSDQQIQLWQLGAEATTYQVRGVLHMRAPIDEAQLRQAIAQVVARHEILRTRFEALSGLALPYQVIDPQPHFDWHVLDWATQMPADQETALQTLWADVPPIRQFFPPLKATLIRYAPEEYALLLQLSALCADGQTLQSLCREICQAYGSGPAAADVPQYADYCEWLHDLQAETDEAALAGYRFWQGQHFEKPSLPSLGESRWGGDCAFSPACQCRPLAPEAGTQLEQRSRQLGSRPTTWLLACWQGLLWRLTARSPQTIGVAIDGRSLDALSQGLGLYERTLPLISQFQAGACFSAQLPQLEQALQALNDWQEYALPLSDREGLPDRDAIKTNLTLCFAYQQRQTQYRLPTGTAQLTNPVAYNSAFALKLLCAETETGWLTELHYDTHRYSSAAIADLLSQFHCLLAETLRQPDACVDQLPLLEDRARRHVLHDFNAAPLPASTQCWHECFEQQAVRTPQQIAVIYEEDSLSYAELDARANQVAHCLQAREIGPEQCVALWGARSLDLLVGLLGILKAGAAYVPLDPAWPTARLQTLLAAAHIPLILCPGSSSEGLPELNVPVLALGDSAIANCPKTRLPALAKPENLAYTLFTSGTTGQPKGVRVEHRHLMSYLTGAIERLAVPAGASFASVSSVTTDLGNTALFIPLLQGGTLHLLSPARTTDPDAFAAYSQRHRIDCLKITPSHLQALLTTHRSEILPRQLLVLGGEVASGALVARIQDWGNCRLVNHYGPTETTVGVLTYAVTDALASTPLPLGRPLPGVQAYVLDAQLNPMPIGAIGDLYIGGNSVSRGYLQPDQTAASFIPDPFSWQAGVRLYRTGDRARYRRDGTLEFCSRDDQQLKLRGFRIELGEIEAVLMQHPSVQQAIVQPWQPASQGLQLAGYVVGRDGDAISETDLIRYAEAHLPEHMVPGHWITLKALPLTASGKVNRTALPHPEDVAETIAFVPASSEVEQILCQIWSQVLHLDPVGIHHNFFDLGGDSILSIQIVAQAHQAGLHLLPKHLFQHQTIAELATVVSFDSAVQADQGCVSGKVPLTPIQQWFFEQTLPEPHHFNQAVLLTVPSTIDPQALQKALNHILMHHDQLRSRFQRTPSGWQQSIVATAQAPLIVVDLSHAADTADAMTAVSASAATLQHSLDLQSGPLLRAALFQLGTSQSGRLLLMAHHLVIDGVSWRILLADLLTAYTQLQQHQPVQLPPKTTAFKTWAEILHDQSQRAALLVEVDYWQAQTQSGSDLPTDARSQNRVSNDPALTSALNTEAMAAQTTVTLDAEHTERLLHAVPPCYNTHINDVLLTVLVQSFQAWTGQSALLVDLEGHGREPLSADTDLSRTVGWFTTHFPVRLELSGADTPEIALKSLKEQLRQIPQNGLGYGLLRYLHPERPLADAAAIPQVCFNYLGQIDQGLPTAPGWGLATAAISPLRSGSGLRSHWLRLDSWVAGGQLQVTWTYSPHLHQPETIQQWAETFITTLESLIHHCQSPTAGGRTPSDFPLAKISQPQLDRLVGNGQGVADLYPLSPVQQGILFHTLYAPESSSYFNQLSATLRGRLNVPAFQQAWQQMIERHPALRSTIHWEDLETPLQQVHRRVVLPWVEVDWRHLSPSEQQRQLDATMQADRSRGFALDQAPLMRCFLARIEEEAYRIVWSFHHLLTDGWCLSIMLREVLAFYTAGDQLPLLPIAPPYRHYLTWLQAQATQHAQIYWQEQLQGFTAPTQLGLERTGDRSGDRSDAADFRQAQRLLSVNLTQALRQVAQQHRLTLNTVIQGAWAMVLAGYSGSTDVVFGATVSGRPTDLANADQMVGVFINTLPVRVRVAAEQLLPWLQALQLQQVEQQRYAYSSLVDIQGCSEVPRGVPLFETILVFENYPFDAPLGSEASGLAVEAIQGFEPTHYPLTLVVVPEPVLSFHMTYDAARFAPDVIDRLLIHMQTVLSAIAKQPNRGLGEFSLLTVEERQHILFGWNETTVPPSPDRSFLDQFAAQVARTPDAVAIAAIDQRLSYAELDSQSNQLAHYLRRQGVGIDIPVGLCLQRSPLMAVALLGVLKAGGAYVPLDPTYPQERLAWMIDDVGMSVLLTQTSLRDKLPATAPVICLETAASLIAQEPVSAPSISLSLESLFYIIYTSGSTGRPKGIALPHRAIANLMQWHIDTLSQGVGVLQFASLSFDASIHEMFAAWATGGTLHLLPEDSRFDPEALADFLAQHPIEKVILPVVLLQQWTRVMALRPEWPVPREIITTGEQLQINQTIRDFFLAHPDCRLHNHYGPSETHVVTALTLTDAPQDWPGYPAIGTPIAQTEIYILDHRMQPVPIGVSGDLYIGGANLSRGYWQRPDLTASKFIPHPYSREPGARLYATGDLARYDATGQIEFLGRLDHQVKVRGFRVELGEIEAVMNHHPRVHQAVVAVQGSHAEEKRLIAYWVPRSAAITAAAIASDGGEEKTIAPANRVLSGERAELNGALSSESETAIRQYLQQQLPDYMVPQRLICLQQLPLTPNGKIDRHRLPTLQSQPTGDGPYQAPSTATETLLAQLWSDVLDLETIGIYDNFFDLGGHSLLATQLVSRVRQAFLLELPLRSLFEHPTIAELATVLAALAGDAALVNEIAQTAIEIDQLTPAEIQAALAAAQTNS
ncbi:amino acid adenylation domain-containing protein [Oscillatoria sp. CS-180]|uniref:non-ribosomal peptide synthetase n=1 Tax=Oscillatoria sp. CS-180 TaxID=3021720 RepID=UPI0023300BF6|nr:non-ribosomal peptide synthetase [Oscillatoria sp. CS-180]MDB9527412.1 amino acid adenylation domain-containing protein [Oscillatoria sp. CS-180]